MVAIACPDAKDLDADHVHLSVVGQEKARLVPPSFIDVMLALFPKSAVRLMGPNNNRHHSSS
jgi:hypothetical protein